MPSAGEGQKQEPVGKHAWAGRLRERLFEMVSVGVINDRLNQGYDILSTGMLLLNLAVSVMLTFDGLNARYGGLLLAVEAMTVLFFGIDYVLRLITAKKLYPEQTEAKAVLRYCFSIAGVIDLLSFLPYYLPVFFPTGVAVFRMFRVARIFRLFRINAYYDSLNVITEVIIGKSQQLLSSVFILMVLMLASSLCMYSLEHDAQPKVFANAFSGIWWSVSTLLTVGYGDIYPVTPLGRLMGILISFLGVGVVAIPTGIISAGFVEQYSRLKRIGDVAEEGSVRFIKIELKNTDAWCGKAIKELQLPRGLLIAAVQREGRSLIPGGNLILQSTDLVILGAESLKDEKPVNIREIVLKKNHPWNGQAICDLDISRQSFVIMIRRDGSTLLPRGNTVLLENDTIYLFSSERETLHERIEF